MDDLLMRDVRDEDSAQILALLASVYAEYESCVLVLDEVPDLLAPATSCARTGGRFWVGERGGVVRAFTACAPSSEAGLYELKKLYVAKEERGQGLARRLIARVEDEARRRGASRVHLWTDTRFLTAHKVYAREGYVKLPETRDLHDASATTEYHFMKPL